MMKKAARYVSLIGVILALFCPLGTFSLSASAFSLPKPMAAPLAADDDYWPTRGWRTSTPEDQGMDSRQLARMLTAIREQKLLLYSFLVIRHGYIVSETYFGTTTQTDRREIYSCTKSFIATLMGIAIDKGYIRDVNQRVADFFPGRVFDNADARKASMTLHDLLTMRSGLDWHEDDPTIRKMYTSRDWVKAVMDEPMKDAPGSAFNYCTGCTHVLSAIIQQATGVSTKTFAEKNLFQPLGMTDVYWMTDPTGTASGGWGIQMSPRDMAKLGYLYLHQGNWDGQQIVAAGWVKTATQRHTGTDTERLDYGFQWWVYPSLGAYTALGREGQTIFVIPRLDLIIVTSASLPNHDSIFALIEQYVVPAVQTTL
ncbi:MAG: serine hydrolase [Anaerolineae bacterium]|nr:serine hydrolase [Anaerolineae bacterium]